MLGVSTQRGKAEEGIVEEDQTATTGAEEDKGDQEDVRIEGDAAQEGHAPRVLPDPGRPTAREREIHDAIRVPFLAWCRECVLG